MTGLDLSAILSTTSITAGVVVGLAGRRALRAWDVRRDTRTPSAPRHAHATIGARR